MKILLCPDSFKGALSAPAAARAMAEGWRRVFPDAELVELPIADGGEGTLDVLLSTTGGQRFLETVTGPLGEPIEAAWGLLPDSTAVIELAQAAGLHLVPPEKRDPKMTTTYGVGELIATALARPDVRGLIVTLGGSATNDGGAGILRALLPSPPAPLSPATLWGEGEGFLIPSLKRSQGGDWGRENVHVRIACDVDNPLTGPNGASAVFGPQKGATPRDVQMLDDALKNFAQVLGQPERPGDGAAGGAAYGLRWLFPNAQFVSGIDLVLDAIDFDRHLEGTNLVLTGEGRLDAQTLGGKAISGVARRARAKGVPVAALVGALGSDVTGSALAEAGIRAALPLAPGPCTLAESIENAPRWLADAAERTARIFSLGR